jgi:hypothetical protein
MKEWKMQKSRGSKLTLADIIGPVQELKAKFPNYGRRLTRRDLIHDYHCYATEALVTEALLLIDGPGVACRRKRKFKRKRFWAAGVHDIWAQDQHDKWERFGLFLHVAVEPVSGYILWLKVWWTNSNPHMVTRYFLDAAEQHRGESSFCRPVIRVLISFLISHSHDYAV